MSYRVFISHAHVEHKELYNSLASRFDAKGFDWRDASVPYRRRFEADAPLNDAELEALLRQEIDSCDVVLAIAKPIATRRRWLKWELSYARSRGKPVIALWRRNYDLYVSSFVRGIADASVDTWRVDTIMRTIETVVASSRATPSKVETGALLSPDSMDDADGEVPPTPCDETEDVAPAEEMALPSPEIFDSVEERAAPTGNSVTQAVTKPPGAPSPIPVDEALSRLGGPTQSTHEAPKDVISRGSRPAPPVGLRYHWSADLAQQNKEG